MRLLLTVFCVLFSVAFYSQIQNIWKLDSYRADSPVGEGVYNEVWGFEQNGEEYALIGTMYGTHFFHITESDKLDYIAYHEGMYSSYDVVHRDYHDYNGYLYEVCDEGSSSLRIYDLHYLPDSIPIVYDDSSLIVRSHNIFIDPSSSLLYSCGNTSQSGGDAIRVLSLDDPINPSLVYDYNFVNYAHDIYVRNDTAFINAADEGLKVVDFSIPTMPIALGSMEFYLDKGYNHSGWLSEDGKTYVMCDETIGMRFKVCDVSDLSDIKVKALAIPPTFENTAPHNVMLKDGLAYFSYYNDGLQVYDVRNTSNPKRIAFYDTYPEEDLGTNVYRGAWGVYALLPSGRILVSDRKYGLFLLGFNAPPEISNNNDDHGIYPNPVISDAFFYREHMVNTDYTIEIYDSKGSLVNIYDGNTDYLYLDLSSLSAGQYSYRYYNSTTDSVLSKKFIVIK